MNFSVRFQFISLFLFLIAFLSGNIAFSQMKGLYTVGQNSTDSFSTLNNAIAALKQKGISGQVVVKIRGGVYNEQVIFPYINGVSSTNQIVFEAFDTSAVEIKFTPLTLTTNYLIKLDSASHLVFRNITFKNTSSQFARIIHFINNNNNIRFTNNIFYGVKINSADDKFSIVYSSLSHDTMLVFDSNEFYFGSDAIFISGQSNYATMNKISANSFLNNYGSAISISLQNGIEITNNTIVSNTSHTQFIGIELGNCKGENIINANKISFSANGFCVLLNRVHSEKGKETMVSNNFVHSGGNAAAIGFFIETCSFINIYFNSIHVSSKTITSAGRCINIQNSSGYCGNLNIKNNIIANKGLGYGLITFTTDTIVSDYNCYYTPNGYLGYWNGYPTNTLSTFTFYSKQDTHSLVTNPLYQSESDLHTGNAGLYQKGKPLKNVSFDIDFEKRDSISPTIGADELIYYKNDISISSFAAGIYPCLNDSINLMMEVKNAGTDTIFSFYSLLIIDNQLIDSIYRKETIPPAQSKHLSCGSFKFKSNKPYKVELKVLNPNNQTDNFLSNNYVGKWIYKAMKDTFIVDLNNTGHYTSLSSAFSDLLQRGICGNTTILIKAGTYTEQLNLLEIPGSGALNKIFVKGLNIGSDSVFIKFGAVNWYANYVMLLGASNIQFENITFIADGNTYGKIVELTGNVHNVSFVNNRFLGRNVASLSGEFNLVSSANDNYPDSNITFSGNLFRYGSMAVWFNANNLKPDKKISLINNHFINQSYYAVSTNYTNDIVITNNNLLNENTSSFFIGFYLNNCFGKQIITSNKLNINEGRAGINFFMCNSSIGNESLISNNFISMKGVNNSSKALLIEHSSRIKVFHNSLLQANKYSSAYTLEINSASSFITLYNNIFVNSGGSGVFYTYTVNNILSDYNLLYTSGGPMGYWSGIRANFAAWVSGSNQDKNSLNAIPYFVSENDLHNQTLETDSAGIPLNLIPYDIDNDLRNSTHPDIGADEYKLSNYDAAILGFPSFESKNCDGFRAITVNIQNKGKQPLKSVKIEWQINNLKFDTTIQFSKIPYYTKQTVLLGFYNFSADSVYQLKAFISNPSGKIDEDSSNNSYTLNELNLISSPSNLKVTDNIACLGKSTDLKAFAKGADKYFWYDSVVSGKLVGTDSIFTTPALKKNKTYYVLAGSQLKPKQISTEMTNQISNLTNGNMFDIVTFNKEIWIDSLDVHTQYNSNYTFFIYTKKGSYFGYQSDNFLWTQIDSVTVKANGTGNLTSIPLTQPYLIQANDTIGFYITTYSVAYMNYSTTTTTYSDANISVSNGIALDYLFDAAFMSNATWNGRIYYSSDPYCQTSKKAVTAFVRDKINITLPPDTFICMGNYLLLDAGDQNSITYVWLNLNTGDTIGRSDTITILKPGKYKVSAFDLCGNSATKTLEVKYALSPEADFHVNSTQQCISNNKFVFTNKSFSLIDTLFYRWSVNKKIFSNDVNTNLSFDSSGIYDVLLTAVSSKGCIDTAVKSLYVYPQPVVKFKTDTNEYCLKNNQVKFNNFSTIESGKLKYFWSFDDNKSDTSISPVHQFTKEGNYQITLKAVSEQNCSDSFSSNITIKPNPKVFLGNDTIICAGKAILLSPGFGFDKYFWSNDSTQEIVRIDTSGIGLGSVNIWVRVIEDGCENTDTIKITFIDCLSLSEFLPSWFVIYPNPGNNIINLEVDGNTQQSIESIGLYSLSGKQILKINPLEQHKKLKIDIPQNLPSGMYILEISTQSTTFNTLWIKQ